MNKRILAVLLLAPLLTASTACASLQANAANGNALKASGTIAARQVKLASEMGGLVIEVAADEGAVVHKGDLLFRVDDSLLLAQRAQAEAAVQVARAERDQLLAGARPEQIEAARAAISSTQALLDGAKADLSQVLAGANNADIVAARAQLAGAQADAKLAQDAYDAVSAGRAEAKAYGVQGGGLGTAEEQMRARLNAVNAQVTAAEAQLNRVLAGATSDEIRGARARVAAVQAQLDAAQAQYRLTLSGASREQIAAADAAVAQAEASLRLFDVQANKLTTRAPQDGTVLARNVEVGQVLAPGATVFVIGKLDTLQITVYLPETTYGQVKLGQKAHVTVDSYPDATFEATVVHIADEAEFTPRNVQTVEGRRATVYAVKLDVPNPDGKLKPGMPADVIFAGD
jgi:HlyD family secretion protein